MINDFERKVKEIGKDVSWYKDHNPERLVEALRSAFSGHELLDKESDIKNFMKFSKHGLLQWSFQVYFEAAAVRPMDSLSSSSADETSESAHSESDIDLHGLGQVFDSEPGFNQSSTPLGPFHAFPDVVTRKYPLELLQVCTSVYPVLVDLADRLC